ncbi:Cyclopentanol dehydrogenase [Arthrobacter sp. 9AX]|uniref:SDR family NAD(P)-dependent oxidoreductase n=1 Tax=Arthrobacter sp. 9AX TaxID=2653131 RepID=UPI0012F1FCE6|nr:SDR family oxidoreductase [Arthrobacter sp. 9AX]VXC13045.1 Cyclopentanol dehydrogenase [Arthrobacter sp. 9AX]
MTKDDGGSRVKGKVAVITGGRGDLGSACAELLAREGAQVASFDVSGERRFPDHDRIREYDVDVTDEDGVNQAVGRVQQELGPIDVLVNAAGIIGRPSPSHESTPEEFDRIFNINVKGLWLMTRAVVPGMMELRRGSVINFSSTHGITGGKSVPLYHATKGAVRLLTKADAHTYGEYGIRFNSIHPGSMRTTMSSSAANASAVGPEAYYAQLLGSNAIKRQGEPMEVAQGVLYLASDESAFSTGSELVIDGGYTSI